MKKASRVFRFAKSAKAARAEVKRHMKNHTSVLGSDYPSDEYTIGSVKRARSKSYKALEKSSGGKVYAVTLKKKPKRRKK